MTTSRPILLAMLMLAAALPASAQQKKSSAPADKKPPAPAPAPAKPAMPPVMWKPSTRALTSATAVEVRFTAMMVAQDAVGEESAEWPITITPAWKGKWTWRSQQSGVFEPAEEPVKGQTYEFAVRPGLVDAGGTPIPPVKTFSAQAAGLAMTFRHPTWFAEHNAPRDPKLILQFNDAVTAAAAKDIIAFVDKAGNRAASVVTQATAGDLPQKYQISPAFRQQALRPLGAHADEAAVKKETLLPATLIAQPAQPLPVGDEWHLVIGANLTSADGKTKTIEDQWIKIGDVTAPAVEACDPVNELNDPKVVRLRFNKALAEGVTTEAVAKLVSVKPAPPGLKVTLKDGTVSIDGAFKVLTPYKVHVGAGLTAEDGLTMTRAYDTDVTFDPVEPAVALPAFSASQLSTGRAIFDLETANMANLGVRVKQADRDTLINALEAFRVYEKGGDEDAGANANANAADEDQSANHRIVFKTMPGKTVLDKKFVSQVALDHTDRFQINWKDVLGGKTTGALFITAEGDAKPEWTGKKKRFGAQAFVQLTDLGLAWKVTPDEAMIYVFSHATGQPVPGAKVSAIDDENQSLATATTAADGTATVPRPKAAWVMAELGDDRHAVAINEDIEVLGMWRMGVPYDWEPPQGPTREVVIFTERPVYLPGDNLYFKAIQRFHGPDGLALPPAAQKVTLRAYDAKGKLFTEREMSFSARGSLDGMIEIPKGPTGFHHLAIVFAPDAKKKGAKAAKDADADDDAEENERARTFESYFLVEEFKPNTFQVAFAEAAFKLDGEKATLPLSARYLLGKTLSKAKLNWTAEVSAAQFSSEAFEGYNFLDSRQTYYYDEDGYHEVPGRDREDNLVTGQARTELTDKGEAVLDFTVPAEPFKNQPREIQVTAEVTDVNQQTISEKFNRTLPSSDFYLGIRQLDSVRGTGDAVEVDLAAAKNDGVPWPQEIDAKVTVEKITFNTVRVQTVGGGSNVRSDAQKSVVAEGTVKVVPKGQAGKPFTFTPKEPGFYYLTARAADAQGRVVESMTSLQIYGEGWASWDEKDGVKIDLTPDKEEYAPGDVAKVLVKCPIQGHALVTVERRKVQKHFTAEIKSNAQVVEVPIDETMAPNAFVSVMVFRGAQNSPKQFKSPEYKAGFCQLKIKDTKSRLAVAVATGQPEYRPGDEGAATATVTDGQGQPVAGAEVTFWAVDEGILSLRKYETPDPWADFHKPIPLAVQSGTSLQALLPENPKELEFTNKGYMIGGGGLEQLGEKVRKNFKPVAFWQGALTTDAKGQVSAKFVVPDNLTKFRVIAIASEGIARFGTGEGGFRINKPLMLEPALPRFADVGDQVTAKGILLNTTQQAFDVEVTLALDGTAKSDQETKKKVALAAGETKAVGFPILFTEPGTAKWKWTAKSVTPGVALADAVESTLEIGLAEPWLRDVKFAAVTDATAGQNMLASINPELLEGQGEVSLTLSNSTIAEASAAIVHLLHYPYGCAEQTTSSVIPWLTLSTFGDGLPGVKKSPAEIKKVIQLGANRLLAMQTTSGGLSYWPGGSQPMLWASAYGGMGLALCQKAGAAVPPQRLAELAAYLSQQLRNTAAMTEPNDLLDRAFACYTLALLGKSEPAYHDVLAKKAKRLPHPARALLALAILESGGTKPQASKLLDETLDTDLEQWSGNLFDSRLTAMSLLVWCQLDSKNIVTVHLIDRLLKERSARGDWGCTYENAWAILALAAETQANAKDLKAGDFAVAFAGKQQNLKFPARPAVQTLTFALTGAAAEHDLKITGPAGSFLRASVEVKSRPKHVPLQPRSQGFGLARNYSKVAPDGSLSPADNLEVGDLIAVTLDLDVPARTRYLAVDDALPSIFEALNPKFKTQASAAKAPAAASERLIPWWSSFEELRTDRALFFADEIWSPGKYEIRYLARVIAEGNVTAPPAKIESMYDPEKYGLSGSQTISARQPGGKVAGK